MPSEFVRVGQVFFSLIVCAADGGMTGSMKGMELFGFGNSLIVCAADGGMSVSVQVIKTVVYFKKIVIKIVCGYA